MYFSQRCTSLNTIIHLYLQIKFCSDKVIKSVCIYVCVYTFFFPSRNYLIGKGNTFNLKSQMNLDNVFEFVVVEFNLISLLFGTHITSWIRKSFPVEINDLF